LAKRIVLSGVCGNSGEIGRAIAKRLDLPYYETDVRIFGDTEILVRLPVEKLEPNLQPMKEFKGIDVIYVQSTIPEQNRCLLELFMAVDTIKQRGAARLTVVVPYLAYVRQDKEFAPGQALSSKVIGKAMKALGVDQLLTVDVHFNRQVGEYMYEGIKAFNATAARALAKYVKDDLRIESPRIVIPDFGHKPVVEIITAVLGNDVTFGSKDRRGENEVVITFPEEEDFNGKTVVIFDDMIGTGTTSIETVKNLKLRGASKVILAVTHTLYINNAREKLLDAGIDKIVATDTIPKEDSVVSIAPIIVDAMKKWGF
jgi:ribose-phosphate pyrophosphokinase